MLLHIWLRSYVGIGHGLWWDEGRCTKGANIPALNLTVTRWGRYVPSTVPIREGGWVKREHGVVSDQSHGCPRNCKRIVLYPRGAERVGHCALTGRQVEGRYPRARRPAVNEKNPTSRAGMPGTGAMMMPFSALPRHRTPYLPDCLAPRRRSRPSVARAAAH